MRRSVVAGLLALVLGLLLPMSLALTPAQEARAKSLGSNLRCPICTGLPITESPNDISREMLRDVREQVAAGRSNREIYRYFAARYGNFVLLDPPKEGGNLVLWGAPLLALGVGAVILVRFLRRRPPVNASGPSRPSLVEEPFDSFLAQVQRETRSLPSDPPSGGSR